MRIALVADPFWPVPPLKYGGTERIVAYLAKGLVERGHDVTLFASGNSSAPVKIIATCENNLNSDLGGTATRKLRDAITRTQSLLEANENHFDIIHWHAGILPIIQKVAHKTVVTLHNPLDVYVKSMPSCMDILSKIPVITPSLAYQRAYPGPKYMGVVNHGLPTDYFKIADASRKNLLFIGRFSPAKNPHIAIKAAIDLNIPITIAARYEPLQRRYFEADCEPILTHPLVTNLGEVDDDKKKELYQSALVNLHPISYNETFGLTIVEAGLCGCPTVAYDRGSMKELIINRVNGFAVRNYKELLESIPQAISLSEEKIRQSYLRYSYQNMARDYERIFQSI